MSWKRKVKRGVYLGMQRGKRIGRRLMKGTQTQVQTRQFVEVVPSWYARTSANYELDGAALVSTMAEKQFLTYGERASSFRGVPGPDSFQLNPSIREFDASLNVEKNGDIEVTLLVMLYNDEERTRVVRVSDGVRTTVVLRENETKTRFVIQTQGKGRALIQSLLVDGQPLWNVEGMGSAVADADFDAMIELDASTLELISPVGRIVDFSDEAIIVTGQGSQYEHYGVQEAALPHVDTKRGIDFSLADMDDYVYRFYLKGDASQTAKATLFVATYAHGERDQLIEVPLGFSNVLSLTPSHESVRYFIRFYGDGAISDLKLGVIRENSVRRTEQFDLDPTYWTIPTPESIKLKQDPNGLRLVLDIEPDVRRYVSYMETNNRFTVLPKENPYTVRPNHRYRVTVDGELGANTGVVLYIISYSLTERLSMQQVQLGSEKIFEFGKDVRYLRFALRVDGQGETLVTGIRVSEEIITDRTQVPEWVDPREARLFETTPRELHEMKVAAIFDEFTTASYRPECELITFSPDDWPAVLADRQPDFLMVESAWKGNDKTWEKKIVKYGTNTWEDLDALLDWCRLNNVPTVFWNKEDPIHYDRFIETAKRFDFVYTTDANILENYKRDCGHDRVGALPFAAQPKEHNPIRLPGTREPYACFAGSYYANRHESRRIDMDRLFAAADKYGLVIYDRNYEMNQRGETDQLQFPEQFRQSIRGSLKYNQIAKAYKGFKVMLNVNSVNDSPTMFSRRVFEGLACATPVVSTRSVGVKQMLGDYVFLDEGDEMLEETFRKLLTDDAFYEDVAMGGMRHVLKNHTYTQRLAQVVSTIGLPYRVDHPKVALVAFVRSTEEMNRVVDTFRAQDYEHKHLVVFLDKFEGHLDVYETYNTEDISTFMLSYLPQYNALSEIMDGFDWMAYIQTADYYGPSYISDYMLATRYAEANILTKEDYFTWNDTLEKVDSDGTYRYVFDATPSRSIMKPDVLRFYSVREALDVLATDATLKELAQSGERIFSTDPYQYVKAGSEMPTAVAQEVQL
ncbi:glycosyltransferase [Exiguobacterium sp. AT1b]|uniref:CgeB family protein n=1 Tax=Exiguobacterium sp. (strain ATCC BAA-1283 / AT1b) TaxID=360911 RepID=UPI00093AF8C9|nr:glycosyltransferase [Exiguobacterium sp. AT1b]